MDAYTKYFDIGFFAIMTARFAGQFESNLKKRGEV